MTATYYNEFDPYAAEWLRSLIAAGRLKGYGNAIVPEVAAEFVRAVMPTAPTPCPLRISAEDK